jgi:hypothetical protein
MFISCKLLLLWSLISKNHSDTFYFSLHKIFSFVIRIIWHCFSLNIKILHGNWMLFFIIKQLFCNVKVFRWKSVSFHVNLGDCYKKNNKYKLYLTPIHFMWDNGLWLRDLVLRRRVYKIVLYRIFAALLNDGKRKKRFQLRII